MPVPVGLSLFVRYHLPVMLPAGRTDSAHDHSCKPLTITAQTAHDKSLQSAVDRLTGGLSDRPDSPDGWVTAVRRMAPRSAQYAPFPEAVDHRLRQVLGARGIEQLYTHQAAAIDHALAGRNVVITTPTASGKTLCYNAPVLSAILQDPSARALYLFPTKALAQDQLAELHELADRLLHVVRARNRRIHLRRRHAAGCAAFDPRPRARGAEQPGHDSFGHPPAPSTLGEAVREPPLRRHRRAARVPRRLRQPPDQCAEADAPHLPALRIESDVHLLVGHDRQSEGACRGAGRAAVRARVGKRRAARREVLPLRQSRRSSTSSWGSGGRTSRRQDGSQPSS